MTDYFLSSTILKPVNMHMYRFLTPTIDVENQKGPLSVVISTMIKVEVQDNNVKEKVKKASSLTKNQLQYQQVDKNHSQANIFENQIVKLIISPATIN